ALTKHIQCKFHFIRAQVTDLVGKGEAIICYVPTVDMTVDILTKALARKSHWKFIWGIGLQLCLSGSVKSESQSDVFELLRALLSESGDLDQ
ncbi:hypothetical protein OG21DRAFT_1425425, partial [Imleria badia]